MPRRGDQLAVGHNANHAVTIHHKPVYELRRLDIIIAGGGFQYAAVDPNIEQRLAAVTGGQKADDDILDVGRLTFIGFLINRGVIVKIIRVNFSICRGLIIVIFVYEKPRLLSNSKRSSFSVTIIMPFGIMVAFCRFEPDSSSAVRLK